MRTALVPSSRDDGFTLVEMLVVIVVIAILAGIAVPLFLGLRTKAQDAAAKADLRNLVMAVTGELQAGHGNYSSVAEMSIALEESPGGDRWYVLSGVRRAADNYLADSAPVDLGMASPDVVLQVNPWTDDRVWTFRSALATHDDEGPLGRDDVVRANWCIGVEHADGRGAGWMYTPKGGYVEGRCFVDED